MIHRYCYRCHGSCQSWVTLEPFLERVRQQQQQTITSILSYPGAFFENVSLLSTTTATTKQQQQQRQQQQQNKKTTTATTPLNNIELICHIGIVTAVVIVLANLELPLSLFLSMEVSSNNNNNLELPWGLFLSMWVSWVRQQQHPQ